MIYLQITIELKKNFVLIDTLGKCTLGKTQYAASKIKVQVPIVIAAAIVNSSSALHRDSNKLSQRSVL